MPIFSPKSDLAWRVKLKGISFRSMVQYNEEYQLYTKGCPLTAKEVAKYYIRGLPHHVKTYLPLSDPNNLHEAIRQVVTTQREVEEARMLIGNTSDKSPKREPARQTPGLRRRFGNQGRVKEENSPGKQSVRAPVRARKDAGVCYNCGEKGHYSPDCTKPCLLCGEMGHGKHKCKKKKNAEDLKRIHEQPQASYADPNPFDILDTLMVVQENAETTLPVVKINIGKTVVDAYVDSGATNSDFITLQLVRELGLTPQGNASRVEGAGGQVKVLGTVEVEMTHDHELYRREFKVLENMPGK